MINIVQHSVTVLNIVQEGLRYFQIVNFLCIGRFSSIPGVPVYKVAISLSFDSISHSLLFLS